MGRVDLGTFGHAHYVFSFFACWVFSQKKIVLWRWTSFFIGISTNKKI